MQIEAHDAEGVFIWNGNPFVDSRGIFTELYNSKVLEVLKVKRFVQQNLVISHDSVIRGMHWQANPYMQDKLISVISGRILDVFIDLRPKSKTFNSVYAIELDSEENRSIYVPKGFAHGYQALNQNTIVSYSVTASYEAKYEKRLNPLSPKFRKFWVSPFEISSQDCEAPDFDSNNIYL